MVVKEDRILKEAYVLLSHPRDMEGVPRVGAGTDEGGWDSSGA